MTKHNYNSLTRATTEVDRKIGGRVRMARLAAGMSQTELGNALGISFQQIQKCEKGVNRIGAARIANIADLFGMSPQALFGESALEAGNPEAIPMMASADGAKLARAFNAITDAELRASVVQFAEMALDLERRYASKPARKPR